MEEKIQIYDIYGWWYKPLWHSWYFKATVGFVGALLGVYFLVKVCRWYRGLPGKAKEPWQEALGSLQAIKLSLFEDGETHRLFYGHITAILKNYLAKRYQLELASKTDQEVMSAIQNSPLPADLQEHLQALMKGAEIIKFAHQESGAERMRYDLMRAIDIVRNTIPRK